MTPPPDAAPIVCVVLKSVTITEPGYDVLELVRGDVVALPIPLFHRYSPAGRYALAICDQSAPQTKQLRSVIRFRRVG